MSPKANGDDDTRILEKKQEAFFNAQMLKILGVGYAVASPFFAWLVISVFEMRSELALQKEKIGTLLEIREDIRTIKSDMQQLKTDVAVLKSKGN